jgi:hypothetical protein
MAGLWHFCHFLLDLWIIGSQYRREAKAWGVGGGADEFANSL